ncbi:MAG: hypothetical protein JWM99_1280 [Verrucomicrobiales bacterium]|nr:hypothetical protein [Verrucomicrobiales bacterium]
MLKLRDIGWTMESMLRRTESNTIRKTEQIYVSGMKTSGFPLRFLHRLLDGIWPVLENSDG